MTYYYCKACDTPLAGYNMKHCSICESPVQEITYTQYLVYTDPLEKKKFLHRKDTNSAKHICDRCGSKEVARCKWVNVNTNEIYDADSGTTLEWCFKCKDETSIVDSS